MSTGTATMVGHSAPALELPDTSGVPQRLPGPDEARAAVVVWTCNHCPYALAWNDRILALAREYRERNVRFFAVNSNDAERYPADSPERMRERVVAEEWPLPYLRDESQVAARAWNAQVTPHVYVIDAGGVIRYEGAPDADHMDPALGAAWLRSALDAVLAGERPDPEATEPVGCTIKWKPGA